jgi:multidrug resistance efflux pump
MTVQRASAPIPTPLSLALSRARRQLLPIFTMIVCASLAGWLWARNARSIAAFGEVSGVRIPLESKFEGMLEELPRPVKVFDSVRAGQIVARIDTSAAEAELRQIEAELQAPAADAKNTTATEPLRLTFAAQQARRDELRLRIASRDIKSPIDGTIVEISHRPGQSAKLGKPIMIIAAERGDWIVGYLRPDQAIRPAPGMLVKIRTRGTPSRTMESFVQSVGPQVHQLPARFFQNPKTPEWGLPVQIAMPPEAELRPGETVDLIFRPSTLHSPR